MVEEDGGLASSGRGLPQGTLEATRVRDANAAKEPSQRRASLGGVPRERRVVPHCGPGQDRAALRHRRHEQPQGAVFLEDLPVHKACFANGGAAVIAAGRRDYFYVYDLARGAVERVAPLVGRPEKSLESFAHSPELGNYRKRPDAGVPGRGRARPAGIAQVAHVRRRREDERLGALGAAFAADGVHLLTAGGTARRTSGTCGTKGGAWRRSKTTAR